MVLSFRYRICLGPLNPCPSFIPFLSPEPLIGNYHPEFCVYSILMIFLKFYHICLSLHTTQSLISPAAFVFFFFYLRKIVPELASVPVFLCYVWDAAEAERANLTTRYQASPICCFFLTLQKWSHFVYDLLILLHIIICEIHPELMWFIFMTV